MRRIPTALLALGLMLAGCAEKVWAPQDAVDRARYSHDAPASITLITVINNRSDEGGHAALLINGSERVIFDPAGTWWHRTVPERNDVLYGITPTMLDFYLDYHARETWRVVLQEKQVPREVADMAIRRVEAYGAVPKTQCSVATTRILRDIPGFEGVARNFWPHRARQDFAQIAGVAESVIRDDDDARNGDLLAAQQTAMAKQTP